MMPSDVSVSDASHARSKRQSVRSVSNTLLPKAIQPAAAAGRPRPPDARPMRCEAAARPPPALRLPGGGWAAGGVWPSRRAGYDGVRVDGTLCSRGLARAAQALGATRCAAIIVVARVALLLLLLFIPAPAASSGRERSAHIHAAAAACVRTCW
eukprot:COSAG01_NODE_13975_length_1494_cov_1.325548_1_plen_154_part_00